ncbi:MAG: DUF302 domain-containing protein [Chloroflexi bacterium]|nr:DUF302 domain-containing protein [Chloroflexota bacterium]
MPVTAITTTTSLDMENGEARLREALKSEGFGILTEVDVQAVMLEKLGAEVAPYRILGACNPHLAHAALAEWKAFGLIAPCHIAIYDEGDRREIIAFDPLSLTEVHENPALMAVAQQASAGIRRAVESMQGT